MCKGGYGGLEGYVARTEYHSQFDIAIICSWYLQKMQQYLSAPGQDLAQIYTDSGSSKSRWNVARLSHKWKDRLNSQGLTAIDEYMVFDQFILYLVSFDVPSEHLHLAQPVFLFIICVQTRSSIVLMSSPIWNIVAAWFSRVSYGKLHDGGKGYLEAIHGEV